MISCKLLTESNSKEIVPFLVLLNKEIPENIIANRLAEMFTRGYKCVGIFEKDNMIGLSGFWILTKYYVGSHIEPDNVIIHPDHRGAGIGEALIKWIEAYALSENCLAAELNCYVTNHAGQKFWTNQGYNIIGFHYQKTLPSI